MARQYPEFKIQCAISDYCNKAFIPERALWHATENSNSRNGLDAARQQAKLRVMGSKKGFPDGLVITMNKTIYVEVKAPKGVLSDEQKALHERIRAMGHPMEVVRSLDQFREMVKRHGVPTREVSYGLV